MNASFTGTEICVHEDRGRQRERGGGERREREERGERGEREREGRREGRRESSDKVVTCGCFNHINVFTFLIIG